MFSRSSSIVAARAIAVHISAETATAFMAGQAAARTGFRSSTLTPDDSTIGRLASGEWTGAFTLPVNPGADVPYTPILLRGPLFFPIVAGSRVDFEGVVDAPFYCMDGWVGRRFMEDPENPGQFIVNPATEFSDGGENWGGYFVVGAVNGVTQFVARVGANRTFAASVANPPEGAWSLQLVTYGDAADYAADANRIPVGNAWLEIERPGDVRDHYGLTYTSATPQFTGVSLVVGATNDINGTLQPFTAVPGRAYQILVTNESDVEYAWALQAAAAGAFTISRPGYQVFGGKIKLRLVEQLNGATVRTVGQVWAEENAAAPGAYPDIRVEYRSITAAIPASPNSITAAGRDGTWSAALIQYGIGRVALVDVNTKRIYGEHTMPSGLLRSFNVPANEAGQSTASVYYDGFNDTCFLYDQAVALIAYLQLGDEDAARRLVDALLTVQNSDGSYAFAVNQATIFAENAGFIRNGAIAWVCYALLLADKPAFRSWFPERTNVAAQNCLDFMLAYRNDLGLFNGGKGQYVDGVLNPDFVIPWWSCEHNLDIWWCLDLAAELYANAEYADAADTLKEALLAEGVGWDAASGIFWQGGIVSGGENTPDGKHALDVMTWGGAALMKWGRLSDARHAIDRAYARYYVTDADTGFSGFTTFAASDGYPAQTIPTPWYEGSFGAVACIRLFDPSHANGLMASLVRAQLADGSYQYALKSDPVNEINTFPCLIAAAWNVLAYSGVGTPHQRILWV